jgi:hypothetical protein
MELWACGFNAWNQLQCDEGGDLMSDAHDLDTFKCILQDDRIEVLRASLSATLSKSAKCAFYHISLVSGPRLASLSNCRHAFLLRWESSRESCFSSVKEVLP